MFHFSPVEEPAESADLRSEVRSFLADTLRDRSTESRSRSWSSVDQDFSRKLGERGWIGMTWPKCYGGGGRSSLERYIVVEELLAAGAPIAAHWAADRQSGPLILRFGTEDQKSHFLPAITRGDTFFCIGMSEPNAGSDLAAVRTTARRADDGYIVNGSKLWTSGADRAHYMILLCRTDTSVEGRHEGMSQLIVDMRSPGITIRPIYDITGRASFNEVFLDDVFVPAHSLIGREGDGWRQVTSELSHERSSSDRFLSSFGLFVDLVRELGPAPSAQAQEEIGRIAAQVAILRQMSFSIAGMIEQGEEPTLQAALVKDLGADLEQKIPEIARTLLDPESPDLPSAYRELFVNTLLLSPAFSLRGGTREILRGIIARGLGLR